MNLLAGRHPLGVPPCSFGHGPGRDLTFLSVTSRFCPAHIFFIPLSTSTFGVCLKTRVGVGTLHRYHGRSSADTLIDPTG